MKQILIILSGVFLIPVITFGQSRTFSVLANRNMAGTSINWTLKGQGRFGIDGGTGTMLLISKDGPVFMAGTLHLVKEFREEYLVKFLLLFQSGAGFSMAKEPEGKGRYVSMGAIAEGGAGLQVDRFILTMSYLAGSTYPIDVQGWTLRIGVKL